MIVPMPRWCSETRGVAVVASNNSDARTRAVSWLGFLLALASVFVLAACNGAAVEVPAQPADGAVPAPEGAPVVIGGTLSLTGPPSAVSADMKAAYDLWAKEINDGGGLLGRPVEMVIYDDHSQSESARSLYQRLIFQDDADLLLAPNPATTAEVLPVAEDNEMLLFNGNAASAVVRSDWLVEAYTYTEPDYSRAVFEMIDAMPEARRPERIGIVTAPDPFLRRVRDGVNGEGGVRRFADERGIDVVVDAEYAVAATDARAIVKQARSSDVDLFFVLAQVPDAVLLARIAGQAGFVPQLYCACGAQVTGLSAWDDLGAARNGIVSTAMTWSTDDHPGADVLSAHVRSTSPRDQPSVHMTGAYAILQVLHRAVDGAGEIDQHALREQVTDRTIDTVLGPIAFDAHHSPPYRARVVQSHEDGDEVVWPPERATSQLWTASGK